MLLKQLGRGQVGPAVSRASTAAVPVATVPCQQRSAGLHALQGVDQTKAHKHYSKHVCHAAVDDEAATTAASAAAASAAERRRLREERRAARQQENPSDVQQYDDLVSTDPPTATTAAPAADDAEFIDDDAADPPTAATAAAAAAKRPSSRLAARRQQRASLRGNKRRVPDALVPDDLDSAAEDGSSDEDDGGVSDSDGDDDNDVFISSSSWSGADEADSSSSTAAADADADADDAGEARTQLPQSVMQQAAAAGRPRQRKPQAEGSAPGQQQQQPQRQGQQQGQQQDGQQRSGGRGARGSEGNSPEPLELSEASPMYLPVLTDEDLDNDPPGHKSGYVAVIGRPNAGKSTLINAMVGQKLSIVTYKPQTTRHRVVGIASDKDYQMILFDTPGIMQEQRNTLDERMMAAVVSSIRAAEVIIAVVDSNDEPQEALAMFQPGPDWSGPPMAVLLNKTDLLSEEQIQVLKDWYTNNCRAEQVFVGSALESSDGGVEAIKAWAVGKLPEGPTLYPKSMVSEQPERFFVSEIIREQIFVQYDQEIPYCCQVQITDFKERPGAKDYIQAVILVEREPQAPIVLGRGGSAIKKLGSAARNQIEDFLGRKVYLELSVQVAPAWRQQADKLKDFGYYDAMYVA